MKKILFAMCILLFGACDDKDDIVQNEPPADIQAILDTGIIIDSISLNYATVYQGSDNFPVIKPNPINEFINKNEILVYFDFMSQSRESVLEYYAKKDKENLEKGYVVEYQLLYYDRLESISIEVKKNNEAFYKINNDSDTIKIIPTPEINSQYGFAKYEMTIEEYTSRYIGSFPDYFVFSFDNKEVEPNTYMFKITFKFNNNKKFVLHTDPINF